MCFIVLALAQQPKAEADLIQTYMDEYGGNPEVYQGIISSKDCEYLQEKFDIAASNNSTYQAGTDKFKYTQGYMKSSEKRMKEIGCNQ